MTLLGSISTPDSKQISNNPEIAPPYNQDLIETNSTALTPIQIDSPAGGPTTNTPQNITKIHGTVRRGETLSNSFKRYHISNEISRQIIQGLSPCLNFKKLRPGDLFSVDLDENGELLKCVYESGPLDIFSLKRTENGFVARKNDVILECRTVELAGVIHTSLFASLYELEKDPKLIYSFADIFASKIDFNTETRKGDRFCLLLEKYYKDDDFIGYGKILYARYDQQYGDNTWEGFYYTFADGKGGYFDKNGNELGTYFIRSPLPVGRVTSKFTTRRLHPILGVFRPHLGIDLAAPRGTPVMAAADGKVKFIGRNGGFGKQIILKHGNGYQTYYGHLSRYRKGLHRGSRVRQKQIIGYVGATGLATGPHLDYRIRANGIFKNPFGIKFTPKSILSGEKLAQYKKYISTSVQNKIEEAFGPKKIIQVKQVTVTPESNISFL